jgi:hypothetical protein
MIQQDELDRTSPTSWRSMMALPHYRKRCIIGFLTTFFVQCSGNLVITSELWMFAFLWSSPSHSKAHSVVAVDYAPLLYRSLGYDANKQLLMAGAWITMCPFGNLLNVSLAHGDSILLERMPTSPSDVV